jgi:hypothetical protein
MDGGGDAEGANSDAKLGRDGYTVTYLLWQCPLFLWR